MSTSASIVALLAISQILGLVRDLLIANRMGSGWQADLIFMALMLPVLFENLFGIAIRDAVIPYLRGKLAMGRAEFRSAAVQVYAQSALVAFTLSLIVVVAAPHLLWILVPGWSHYQRDSAISTFTLGAILIGVQTVLYVQTALLNGEGKFILPNWRTVLMNLAAIATLAVFGSALTVVASIVVSQAAWMIVMHWRVRPYLAGERRYEAHSDSRKLRANLVPLVVTALAQQASVLAERWFASRLEEGSITLLSLAYRLVTIPQTIFAMAIFAVIFPILALYGQACELDRVRLISKRSILIAMVLTVPSTMILVAIPISLVSLMLERGAFRAQDVERMAPLVAAYAAGLPALCAALVWGRVLVAVSSARTLAAISIISFGITLLLDMVMVGNLGSLGLALALTIGTVLQAGLSAFAVAQRIPGAVDFKGVFRWIISAVLGTLAIRFMASSTSIETIVAVTLSLIGSSAVLWLMGEREIFRRAFWRSLRTDTIAN